MPSELHEVIVSFFTERPELAPLLLERSLGVALPRYSKVKVESATLTDIKPAEYRADVVILLRYGKPVLGIVVEVQLRSQQRKRFTWPAYVTGLRARFQCPACLLVVVPNQRTARWAAEPIDTGPGGLFTPFVIGPQGIPVVTEPSLAMRYPELAVMSVMAHGKGDAKIALTVAQFAAAAALHLDPDKQALYLDIIENALGEAARKAFQMLPQHYQFKGPSYREGRADGEADGEAKGKADSVLLVLETRGIAVTDQQSERISKCDDLKQLDIWLRKAMTVTDVEALFES